MWISGWKQHKWKVVASLVLAAVLAGVFYYGGNAPGAKGWRVESKPKLPGATNETGKQVADVGGAPEEVSEKEPAEMSTPFVETSTPPVETKVSDRVMVIDPETGKDKYQTDPVPEGKPLPVEPQDIEIGMEAYTCTVSIYCSTILANMDICDPEKMEMVPDDGCILESTTVTFYRGESVFDVLRRVCKQLRIHMEYKNTPIYNSAYIQGIHNLYEFDVGELSGWMYKVNGWFPNYGCSRYQLQNGDEIDWVYTCDLGFDVGGGYAVGG